MVVPASDPKKKKFISTGPFTLRAECNFGPAGKIDITEHFYHEIGKENRGNGDSSDESGSDDEGCDDLILAQTGSTGGGSNRCNKNKCVPACWWKTPAKAEKIKDRYLAVEIPNFNGLCPRSSYTLTFHQYNNVGSKCKNVGPLLGGASGIVTESLAIGSRGDLTQKFSTRETLKIPLSLIPTQFSPISALGGSCVLTLNNNCSSKSKSKGGKSCKPACPVKLCAPIVLSQYAQVGLRSKKCGHDSDSDDECPA